MKVIELYLSLFIGFFYFSREDDSLDNKCHDSEESITIAVGHYFLNRHCYLCRCIEEKIFVCDVYADCNLIECYKKTTDNQKLCCEKLNCKSYYSSNEKLNYTNHNDKTELSKPLENQNIGNSIKYLRLVIISFFSFLVIIIIFKYFYKKSNIKDFTWRNRQARYFPKLKYSSINH